MHRLPIVAGLALSIVAAGTTFAAAPKTTPVPAVQPATPAAAQVWTARLSAKPVHGAATLAVRAGHTSGRVHVNVAGLTKSTTAEAVILEHTSKGTVILSTDMARVTTTGGTFNVSWNLNAATVAKIEAGIKAKDALQVEVKDGKTVVGAAFAAKA